jgi:hypothetical protein
MRIAMALAALLVLVAACGAGPGDATTPPPVADDPPAVDGDDEDGEAVEGDMTIEGTLGGDAQLEGGCVWLDTDEGRYEVLWPEGYHAEVDPVRLVGPDGATLAEAGDALRVEGAVSRDVMTICQVGTVFSATAVEAR